MRGMRNIYVRIALITCKGLRCLRVAEVMLYDHLTSLQLLDEIRLEAERIHVGERYAPST